MKIAVAATIDFATKADRDAAVEVATPIQQRTRDEQPGCLAYCFGADPCVDTRMQVFELWEDADSLAAHFANVHYAAMREALGKCGIVAAWNQKYEISRHEPVYDETHTARADFFSA